MTPEDTPRMAESDRQAEDPWEKVNDLVREVAWGSKAHHEVLSAIDVARASDAVLIARLQAEIADFCMDYRIKCDVETKALHVQREAADAQIATLTEKGVILMSAAAAASGYLERLQPDLSARLWSAVEGWQSARAADAALLRERDAQIASLTAQVKALETELDATSAFIARATGPDGTLNLAVDVEARAIKAEQERDAAQQENQTLREALDKLAREALVVVGFAQSWMPLSVGDIADLRRAGEQARATLASRPQEPHL